MSSSPFLTEDELRTELAGWLYRNRITAYYTFPGDLEAFCLSFRLPEFDYEHTRSCPDENGDLITFLRAKVHLSDIETFSKKDAEFVFYKILCTYIQVPHIVPDTLGYVILHAD
ncbi:MAG: hypothetical protein IJC37_05765 [Clostridia bacterium]|nr:hypothetical protein [Clostridia bacterium]